MPEDPVEEPAVEAPPSIEDINEALVDTRTIAEQIADIGAVEVPPPVEEGPAEEPAAEEPPVDPPADEPPVEDPPADPPPAEEPPADPPPAEEPPVDPPAEEPPA